MPRQLHSAPAAAAMTLILSAAGFAFVTLGMLASGSPIAYHLPTIASAETHVHNLATGVMTILFLGYLFGIVGWLLLFAAHADGKHRLETLRLSHYCRSNEWNGAH